MFLTDIDELNVIIHDGVERQLDVLQHLVLIDRLLECLADAPALQHLNQRNQVESILKVRLEIVHPLAHGFELFVDPVGEGLLLDLDPSLVVVVADAHGSCRVSFTGTRTVGREEAWAQKKTRDQ